MNLDYKKISVWAGGVVIIIVIIFALLAFFNSSSTQNQNTGGSFGTAGNQTSGGNSGNQNSGNNNTQIINTAQQGPQKIFKIADGPVAGATFLQTQNSTTTLAHYVMQDNGHVFDLPVDSPGAVARAVSNTTIPGIQNALWLAKGSVILQYASGGVIKSVYLGFPAATSTGTMPTQIRFLPDNIVGLAGSPDGKSVAYILKDASGTSGYTANADGSGSKKLFSLPLTQLLLSWPAQGTLLLATKSAVGVPGMAFSVDAKTGSVVPILYGLGLTATADKTFATVIYQTADGAIRSSFTHYIKSGGDARLSFNPFPEKCVWSAAASNVLYCAAPLQTVVQNYLELWHQGSVSAADTIFSFDIRSNIGKIFVIPGSSDGGVSSDIAQMALSPDDHYLLYITRGDRSLWGVRLR